MTRRLWLTFLRVYPGAALVVLVAAIAYALGHHRGYVERAAEEFRWHTSWEVQP